MRGDDACRPRFGQGFRPHGTDQLPEPLPLPINRRYPLGHDLGKLLPNMIEVRPQLAERTLYRHRRDFALQGTKAG